MGGPARPGIDARVDGAAQLQLGGVGQAVALEVAGEVVRVGGVGGADALTADVRRQPRPDDDGADDVLEVVLDDAGDDRRPRAAQPGAVAARRLDAGDVVDAVVVEQRHLGVAQGAGAEPLAEEAAHGAEEVAVEAGLDAAGVEPVDGAARREDRDVEAAPVVGEPEAVAADALARWR